MVISVFRQSDDRCDAAYTLLSRKLLDGISSLETTLAASLVVIPLFVALAFLFDYSPFDFPGGDSRAISALLFWARPGGLAPVLWYRGARKARGGLTAGAMAIMPLSALALSYWLLGEAFRWIHLVGFGMVFERLVLMTLEHSCDGGGGGESHARAG